MSMVSVIVPVYNSEKYLEACIDSVVAQTYTNWELILVNDGSTDNSEHICRRYSQADARIIFVTQKNQGVSAARNTGMDHATGDYFVFLDSDDELETNAIAFLMDDMMKHQADIASGAKCFISPDGGRDDRYCDGEISTYAGNEMIRQSLSYDKYTRSLHAKLIRREFLGDIRFVDGHNINEDGYFLFQCYAKFPKVVQHNISAYKYFTRETSASRSKFSEKYFDMIYFCDLKMQYIRENLPEFMEAARDMEVRTHLLFLSVLCRAGVGQYRDAAKNSIRIVRKRFLKYRPINSFEKKMAAIVACGLYPAYRCAFQIRFGLKNRQHR